MNVGVIRKKLHGYLDNADDKKVIALYTLMEDDIEEVFVEYTDELKTELDKRLLAYQNGKSKPVSSSESKKRISAITSK